MEAKASTLFRNPRIAAQARQLLAPARYCGMPNCASQLAENKKAFRPQAQAYCGPLPQREHSRVAVRLEILADVISAEKEKTEKISS